jgi:tripartite-type tricarboxylate transporter receptor subunit TctC
MHETKKPVGRRQIMLASIALCDAWAMLTTPSSLSAQTAYPSRPLKMIVPWPPGQASDLAGRVLAQELGRQLGQPVVVDNKAGAGGTIGTDAAAKSVADGYTLLAASSGPVSASPLLTKTPFDVDRDLYPLAMLGISPYVLAVAPGFPAKDLPEFVSLLKSKPGKYSFASSGTGATAHLITESFNAAVGIKAVHVPYKGSAPAITDLISGQVDYCIETAASIMPFVRNHRLHAYGISLAKTSPSTPGLMPFSSFTSLPGLEGFDLGAWFGFMLPTGTPNSVIERLSQVTEKVMLSAEVRQAFSNIAIDVDYRRSDEFGKYLKFISNRFGEIIKANNIKAE